MSAQILNDYEHSLAGKSRNTRALYLRVVREYLTVTGATPPFNTVSVATYLTTISSKNAGSSVATKLMVLGVFMRWAIGEGLAEHNTLAMCQPPRYAKTPPRVALEDEVTKLIASVPPKLQMALMLAAYLGLRESEIRGLTWGAIDLASQQLTVIGKGNKLRVLPIVDEDLLEYLRRRQGEGFVVPGDDGQQLTRGALGKALARHCEKLGIRRLNMHSLRHYRAGRWAVGGVGSAIIGRMLGHNNLQTTEVYLQSLSNVDTLREGLLRAQATG